MSVSRCQTCGYRNNQMAHFCMNCGESLDAYPLLPSADPQPVTSRYPVEADNSSVAVSGVLIGQSQEGYSPYSATVQERATDLNSLERFDAMSSGSAQSSGWRIPARLPFGFAVFRPALVGKIIHMEAREQVNDFPNFAGALLAILAEIIWAIPNVQGTRDPIDRIEITRLRIESEDGEIYDAMIRGSLRGANLSMGDTVSLWGRRRKGNLIVRKGYDHATRSTISTTGTGLLLPALLILVGVVAFYLLLSHMSLADAFQHLKDLPAWFKRQMLPFLS